MFLLKCPHIPNVSKTDLVHELGGEVDAELGREQGNAALAPPVLGIEGLHLPLPRLEVGTLLQFHGVSCFIRATRERKQDEGEGRRSQ